MENDMDRFKFEFRDHVLGSSPEVKRRVNALKKLLVGQIELDVKFHNEMYGLECKYHQEHIKFYNKRNDIIQGNYEPTDEECDYSSDEEKDGDAKTLSVDMEKKVIHEVPKKQRAPMVNINSDQLKGIPNFWLTVLKNTNLTSDIVQSNDEPILRHLEDIKIYLMKENMSFALEFIFSPNEWFTNTSLTKEYELRCAPDEKNPLDFNGPSIFKCKGCIIHWNLGKNVTEKVIKVKHKDEERGNVQFVNKTIQNISFFHFFNPPTMPVDPESDVREEIEDLLKTDFEIGEYLRYIIPKAVLYFTGEALLDDSDSDICDEEFE